MVWELTLGPALQLSLVLTLVTKKGDACFRTLKTTRCLGCVCGVGLCLILSPPDLHGYQSSAIEKGDFRTRSVSAHSLQLYMCTLSTQVTPNLLTLSRLHLQLEDCQFECSQKRDTAILQAAAYSMEKILCRGIDDGSHDGVPILAIPVIRCDGLFVNPTRYSLLVRPVTPEPS